MDADTEQKLVDLAEADGARFAAMALRWANGTPDVALMILGCAVNAVVHSAPEDQRFVLLRRFLTSFGVVKEVEPLTSSPTAAANC